MIRAPRHLGFSPIWIVPAIVLFISVANATLEVGATPHQAQDPNRQIHRLLEVEDSRPSSDAALQPLLQGLKSEDFQIRGVAVRGLGRLERLELVLPIAEMLSDESPAVRSVAADALAQAAFRGGAHATAIPLLAAVATEEDPSVRGALAQALGRLQYATAEEVREAEQAMRGLSVDAPAVTLLGVARGFEFLARQRPADTALSPASVARLRQLTSYGGSAEAIPRQARTLGAARVRRLAVAALNASGDAEPATVKAAAQDADEEVRRLAAVAAVNLANEEVARELNSYGLRDSSPRVRYQALGVYEQMLRKTFGCEPIALALNDRSPHVALLAIDLLGSGCSNRHDLEDLLIGVVGLMKVGESNPSVYEAWHRPAHALVALSRIRTDAAAVALPYFVSSPVWQTRMYAARAAANVNAYTYLEGLARDPHPNVREAAIPALSEKRGHANDSLFVAALDSDDYQLLMTAANALEGSPDATALPALTSALGRITAQRRQTSRDARRALINRVGELGDASLAEALTPYLRDFDPLVAEAAARILTAWTEEPHRADPQLLPREPFPTFGEVVSLVGARVLIEMDTGGVIELRLFPFEAPTNAARFARLARAGYYDGLTFHRVVPNFVVQGGSPGANEFWGDGPFTRDEVTMRSNLRGTVGLSTRGRDTGDAQVFINLVDNVRLDHNFTLFGEVVSGMDVVDAAMEGATMKSVVIVEGAN